MSRDAVTSIFSDHHRCICQWTLQCWCYIPISIISLVNKTWVSAAIIKSVPYVPATRRWKHQVHTVSMRYIRVTSDSYIRRCRGTGLEEGGNCEFSCSSIKKVLLEPIHLSSKERPTWTTNHNYLKWKQKWPNKFLRNARKQGCELCY